MANSNDVNKQWKKTREAAGPGPSSKLAGKSRTATYSIDGKKYDFQYVGDKKPSGASILQTFRKHHPQSAQKKNMGPKP